MKPTVMLIGLGDLGGVILELLARDERLGRIVVGSRSAERGRARCNLARLSAMAQGLHPRIEFVALDLDDRDAAAAAIARAAPDLILSTASRLTWWLPDLLPEAAATPIKRAGFGVWLPVHLAPTLKLMEAVHMTGYAGHTLTAPFPDVVNPILERLQRAPTCGIGNLDEIVPKIQTMAAERLGCATESVQVHLVAHHAIWRAAFTGVKNEAPPYFLRVEREGVDVTDEVRADELLFAPYPITSGRATHFLTAGSALRLIRALLSKSKIFLHAPAPYGLPGGYPIVASAEGVRPALPDGLSLDEAISINERSHRFDGIETIERDGSVVFRADAAEALRETLGYDCARLHPTEADARGEELVARFREYARRHGVDIDRARAYS